MSEQGWLKREIETVRREVAAWPAWKRGGGMEDVKRYKLSQGVCYGDGAFVIPAGQVVVREADYEALREQNRVLDGALRLVLESWVNGRKVRDGIGMEVLTTVRAALTATSQSKEVE